MSVEIPLYPAIPFLGMQTQMELLCHVTLFLCTSTVSGKSLCDFIGGLDTPMVEDAPETTNTVHWTAGRFLSACGAARGRIYY